MYINCSMEGSMSIVLPTIPITDLRTKQGEILDHLQESPVVLTHHGRSAAVLVSTVEWNAQQRELQNLRLLAEAMQIKAKGEPRVTLEEVKSRIAAKKAAESEVDN
jgi:prevent-host-death family protein